MYIIAYSPPTPTPRPRRPDRPTNQSIKGTHKATHGPRRSHIPAPPQGGGLGLG